MKKSILMSIQPYWGFLIIAKGKGWDLKKYGLQEKTVEVRKGIPTSPDWDKKVALYFSKNKKSLARIPEEYRGEVAELCGKVVGEFVCDHVTEFWVDNTFKDREPFYMPCGYAKRAACLQNKELNEYGKGEPLFGWHISDLKIYDKPKKLREFGKPCNHECAFCDYYYGGSYYEPPSCGYDEAITRPPQSWCYVEEMI